VEYFDCNCHTTPAFKLVAPSKCTVLIQKVLLVDWLGVTVTTAIVAGVVELLLAVCANTIYKVDVVAITATIGGNAVSV
jgi:hypothetical protein